jgi:hypothetical protein
VKDRSPVKPRPGARLRAGAETLAQVAADFVAYYSRSGGCSNCGGLPHTTTCFVGRFQSALPSVRSARRLGAGRRKRPAGTSR